MRLSDRTRYTLWALLALIIVSNRHPYFNGAHLLAMGIILALAIHHITEPGKEFLTPPMRRFVVILDPDASNSLIPAGYYLNIYATSLTAAQRIADQLAPGAWAFVHQAKDLTAKQLAELCPQGEWATTS